MWKSTLPLYKQVAKKIKDDIVSNDINRGEAIPTETKLAEMYGVSRVTIRQAVKLLVEEGLVYSVQGSGTYISEKKIEHDIHKLQGFTEEMISLHNNPSNEILEFQLMLPSEEVKNYLKLTNNQKVYYIKRLRLADEKPLVLEESYMPYELFPDLSVDVMKVSKYKYIAGKGFSINKRHAELVPILPTDELVEHLHLENKDPMLLLEAYSTFDDGTIFEYSKVYFHPKRYTFKFVSEK
ncbi:GntR family transcriptional regulator [Salinicoccus sp. ID82-1]|uniref:GntR family transcriptional regulator n=1 Tax=Salinicoccus sp. ID82-1 TaxID=2820269 RepID=UPI001F2BC8DC|nr:GntR family transcriptional regulator [Salinicoccus sp. ID82-1]MCG1008435.1 GntR family transcriptional regulator [Salinicoccus sp. ID82-1]